MKADRGSAQKLRRRTFGKCKIGVESNDALLKYEVEIICGVSVGSLCTAGVKRFTHL